MSAVPFPELPSLQTVQERLKVIFPQDFQDRALLVGPMAARVVYVFLYGGFVGDGEHLLRPSHVYLFTQQQADQTTDGEREAWRAIASRPGFRPSGERWYADNSRESIRDDLLRNRMLPLGLVTKRAGQATTSSRGVWSLSAPFADLFRPSLRGEALEQAVSAWRKSALDPATLERMALRAEGLERRAGDIFIDLPDGARIRVSAGPSNLIAKGLIEDYAPRHLKQPAVLWMSASDSKTFPQFERFTARLGLTFNVSTELPDLILADMSDPIRVVFCEVVATDGPMTEVRRETFARLVTDNTRIPIELVAFLTAYEDRSAPEFRRHFSRLALGSEVWFRTEPDLVVRLERSTLARIPLA